MASGNVFFGEHKTRWVTISEDEYESMKATIEVLSDKKLMKQLAESEEDIRAGRVRLLGDVKKELGV